LGDVVASTGSVFAESTVSATVGNIIAYKGDLIVSTGSAFIQSSLFVSSGNVVLQTGDINMLTGTIYSKNGTFSTLSVSSINTNNSVFNNIIASTNIVSLLGDLYISTGAVLATSSIVSLLGDLNTSTGRVVANSTIVSTRGDIRATTGNIVAAGLTTGLQGVGYPTSVFFVTSQNPNKTSEVTAHSTMCGVIVTPADTMAGGTTTFFNFKNSYLKDEDLLLVNCESDVTCNYFIRPGQASAGNVQIYIKNVTGATLGDSLRIRYAIFRCNWAGL